MQLSVSAKSGQMSITVLQGRQGGKEENREGGERRKGDNREEGEREQEGS